MPTERKSAAIAELQETFDKSTAIFLADFTGLDVEKMTQLRRKCRENEVSFRVIKNTLAIKALRALELQELEEHFRGPTALAVSRADPTAPARVLVDFHKEHEKPHVKLGIIEGRVLDGAEVKAIASLPTRDQLISQVMQLALAPAQNFVGVLNAVLSKLVRTVEAVRVAKEEGAVSSPAPAETQEQEKPETEQAQAAGEDEGEGEGAAQDEESESK